MVMNQALILYPVFAMLLLVLLVTALMLRERVQEMKSRRIHPQKVATSTQMGTVLHNTRAADNYKNLFEMPVLFYVWCLALLALQLVSPLFLGLAWAYVALRCLHSFVHIGYNKVMHRFNIFALSATLLLVMWTWLVLLLLLRG